MDNLYFVFARPIEIASHGNHVEAVRALHELGAPIESLDKPSKYWGGALHLAAMFGKTEAIEVLLELGAKPLAKDGNGQTPIDKANTGNQSEAALLIANKAGLSKVDIANRLLYRASMLLYNHQNSDEHTRLIKMGLTRITFILKT